MSTFLSAPAAGVCCGSIRGVAVININDSSS
jgi:hypothetical protein